MIGQDRSIVVKRATDFVSRISNSEAPSSTTGTFQPSTTDGDAEPQKFPSELLYMMTMNPEREPRLMKRSFWPAHISLAALENMCLSSIDRSAPVRRHLEQSKKRYENEIHRTLGELDFLAPPSLAFLQKFNLNWKFSRICI
ncbi:hypothetical protein AFLA_011374 [Aspergillus flavus NRRL3357]|nr:hypothetical protein AFLA_011374 [Aspergillus flavus NRRL3357]KAJ1708835.1 hypothetical protein NYO67_9036 [Aspergillus flavus]